MTRQATKRKIRTSSAKAGQVKTPLPSHCRCARAPVYVNNPKLAFIFRRPCLLVLFLWTVAASTIAKPPVSGQVDDYQVVHAYPHDSKAFTQGLIYVDGHLYESTGLNGRSSLRMVELPTGRVLQKYDLPAEYFGEGLTDWGSNLIQLTWRAHKGFVYDRFSFSLQRTFQYSGEGWGLTHDGTQLIMSDGTSYLRFLDPKSFRETRRVQVVDEAGHAIENLNELEYIHGEIYANIWQTDKIVRISPRTGKVLGWIDLNGIIDKREIEGSGAVLNGIAYDSRGDRLFVTGKLWPKLFEIRVAHR
jgi:glutamine cyclotransferase